MSAACELCNATDGLAPFTVEPRKESVVTCSACRAGLDDPGRGDTKRWHSLRESMWSESSAVKVLAYRILKRLEGEPWAADLRAQMYLEDDDLAWAEDTGEEEDAPTLDSNGTRLADGDTVTLIKDLDVKGAGFTAKRGTSVKGIALTGDPKYVEGRVNGMTIVLVAAYLKKA